MTSAPLAVRLSEVARPLFFPVTAFGPDGAVDLAVQYARAAEEAGADGLLAMPPYLVVAGQAGLLNHYTALAAATGLEVIVYQRDNAVFTPETVVALARTPGIIGLKDGHGDLDLMQRIVSAVRTHRPDGGFLYFNGLPTAELTGPAYRGVGEVRTPLTEPPAAHVKDLIEIIASGRALLEERASPEHGTSARGAGDRA